MNTKACGRNTGKDKRSRRSRSGDLYCDFIIDSVLQQEKGGMAVELSPIC